MKKRAKSKSVVIVLILLIIISLSCGTIGLLQSKKPAESNNNNNKEKDFKVAYKYYLDGSLLSDDDPLIEEIMTKDFVENENPDFEGATTTTPLYTFERYTCTNKITGEWDEEKWEFKPDLTNNSTCSLYFLKTNHTVTFKASNGKLPNNQEKEEKLVELNKEGIINITPNAGYKYSAVTCDNGVLAEYNEETKDLTVSNVKKDSTCTISFAISDYTVEIKASNGTITEDKKTANYGGTLTFDVEPSENYRFANVSCTNNQKASHSNGKITVSGITNDTVCTVEFKPIKYQVTINLINGTLDSELGNPQGISEGKNATFKLIPNTGYKITDPIVTCTNGIKPSISADGSGGGILSIYGVTTDITCTVTLKAAN